MEDLIVNELYEKQSLAACIYLVMRGRELEFSYKENECFLSKDGSKKEYSLWIGKQEQAFESLEELLQKALIDNVKLMEIWQDIELGILY